MPRNNRIEYQHRLKRGKGVCYACNSTTIPQEYTKPQKRYKGLQLFPPKKRQDARVTVLFHFITFFSLQAEPSARSSKGHPEQKNGTWIPVKHQSRLAITRSRAAPLSQQARSKPDSSHGAPEFDSHNPLLRPQRYRKGRGPRARRPQRRRSRRTPRNARQG